MITQFSFFENLSGEVVRSPMEASPGYRLAKRATDICLSIVLLLLLFPILLLISALLFCSRSGPILFSQRRLTTNGRVFSMYKFRTMVQDAELHSGAVYAAENDPRITRLGRILRRYRLDETPQLINVFLGDMSLVGPRPERPEMVGELIQKHPRFEERLGVPAGLTGLAQIKVGYSSSSRQYRHKLTCDRLYIQNQSLTLDMWILSKTVSTVITGKGAC